jgi:AraC family transcriptional regulator
MLNNCLSGCVVTRTASRTSRQRVLPSSAASSLSEPAYPGQSATFDALRAERSIGISSPTVDVAPHRVVTRNGLGWNGVGVEFVRATMADRVDYSFRSPQHLLVAYRQGVRRDGESYVEGVPRSALRDVAKKLTFAPAGHDYREWYEPRVLTDMTYCYFDPSELQIDSEERLADMTFAPKLFFEDEAIWSTVAKLGQAIEAACGVNLLYIEALGVVLIHELIRLNRGIPQTRAPVRGGLAVWQQRIVTAYIEEHLSEQIPLAKLARLARLSAFHFCRAFKQSFGIPPHRYHTNRRIEQAKVMLATREHSITEVGLILGFSETSSFTAVFRKITGQTPSGYHRDLD